jgi:hypothetical protein
MVLKKSYKFWYFLIQIFTEKHKNKKSISNTISLRKYWTENDPKIGNLTTKFVISSLLESFIKLGMSLSCGFMLVLGGCCFGVFSYTCRGHKQLLL